MFIISVYGDSRGLGGLFGKKIKTAEISDRFSRLFPQGGSYEIKLRILVSLRENKIDRNI